MAPGDALEGEPAAPQRTPAGDRLEGVLRTRRVKTAGRAQHRGEEPLVPPDQDFQHCADHRHDLRLSSSSAPSRYAPRRFRPVLKSPNREWNGRFNVARRPMTTKSHPSSACNGMTWPTATRRRRRTRFRATAFPTLRLAVNPTRMVEASAPASSPVWRRRTCRTNPGAAHFRRAAATLRNWDRRFRRATGGGTTGSGGQALASLGAPIGQDSAAAHGRHAGAETVPPLADELAWLKGPFHNSTPTTNRPRCIRSRRGEVNGGDGELRAAVSHTCLTRW